MIPRKPGQIHLLFAWTYTNGDGKEEIFRAAIPPGVFLPMVGVVSPEDEDGIDAIARNAARRACLQIAKRVFVADVIFETYDGRTDPPSPEDRT